jgi:hypothetical protein
LWCPDAVFTPTLAPKVQKPCVESSMRVAARDSDLAGRGRMASPVAAIMALGAVIAVEPFVGQSDCTLQGQSSHSQNLADRPSDSVFTTRAEVIPVFSCVSSCQSFSLIDYPSVRRNTARLLEGKRCGLNPTAIQVACSSPACLTGDPSLSSR